MVHNRNAKTVSAQKLRSLRGRARALAEQTQSATSIRAKPMRSANAVRAGLGPRAVKHTAAKARVIPAAAKNQRRRRTRPILVHSMGVNYGNRGPLGMKVVTLVIFELVVAT